MHVYKPGEYAGMRTFLAKDGKSGFAIKGDDIVSLFKHPSSTAKHVADAALKQAVANGGRRLDAFDTVLPDAYAKSGFRAVARLKWDDKHAPAGWDKETFKKFNKGEPDVVFMVHDERAGKYKKGDGVRVKSYDEGKAEQDKALARIHAHPGAGYTKGSWVDQKGVIHTDSVHDAALALFQNKKVELHQLKQVSTLIHELGAQAKSWQQQGKEAPVFNLCNVSVEGTNLFCAESKGIPRVEMPVIPAKRTKDFIKYLRNEGYDVEKDTERADHLRATQSEISGAKVAASMDRIEKEGFYKRLVVSRDDYILDGHHTWAGEIGLEAKKGTLGDEKTVKIARVDISITKLIAEADKWMKAEGLAKKPASEAAKTLGEVIREWFERQPGHDVSDEPRDPGGKWTEAGGGGAGAAEHERPTATGKDVSKATLERINRAIDAIPAAHAAQIKDVPIKAVATNDDIEMMGLGDVRMAGLFRSQGPNAIDIQIPEKITVIARGVTAGYAPLKSIEKSTVHEMGHALDHANGWKFSPRIMADIRKGARRLTRDERTHAAYFTGSDREGFAETYALVHAPKAEGETFFGGLSRARAEQAFPEAIKRIKALG